MATGSALTTLAHFLGLPERTIEFGQNVTRVTGLENGRKPCKKRNNSAFSAFPAHGRRSGKHGEPNMRVLFGIILGVVLTIGVAFVSDTWTSSPVATNGSASVAVERHTMVNWDVVGENLRIVRQRAREAWTKLSHMVTS